MKRKVKACWHHVLLEDQFSNCYMLFTVAILLPMLHSHSSVLPCELSKTYRERERELRKTNMWVRHHC